MDKFTLLTAAAMSLASFGAQAGFAVTDQFRIYGVGVTPESQTTISHQERGYYRDSLIHTGGGATAKLDHESLIDNDAYKSMNLIKLTGTPRVQGSGGLAFSVFDMIVETSTQVRINYEVDIVPGIDSYHSFVLENTSISQTTYMLETLESTSGSILLTLDPGHYNFAESTTHAIREPNTTGNWSIRSVVSMTTVPAPTTTLALASLGIGTTRRRR